MWHCKATVMLNEVTLPRCISMKISWREWSFAQHDNVFAGRKGGAMELSIRPATIADYAGVALIFDEIDRLHRQALPHIFRAVAGHALERPYFETTLDDSEADWL